MSKLLKDEKFLKKFIKQFNFILNNKAIKNIATKQFDHSLRLSKFVLITLFYTIKKPQIENIKAKKDKLLKTFLDLYSNQIFIKYHNLIQKDFNTQWIKYVKFIKYANDLLSIFHDTIINQKLFLNLINNGLLFIFLNNIDCQITLSFNPKNIEFENKKIDFIIQNTKYFSKLKKIILENLKNNVNDFITLIIGLSKKMYKN